MSPIQRCRILSRSGVLAVGASGEGWENDRRGQDKSASLWRRFAVGFSRKDKRLPQAALFGASLPPRRSRCSTYLFRRLFPA